MYLCPQQIWYSLAQAHLIIIIIIIIITTTRKQCDTGRKLVLLTNGKWHMCFRLVLQSVTLNDHERCAGRCVASKANYVKFVEAIPGLQQKCSTKNLLLFTTMKSHTGFILYQNK